MGKELIFSSSIEAICKNGIRIGIWIKKEFETEKVKHFLVDISIEEQKMLTVYENVCIGLDTSLIDSTTEDGMKYRSKVFDILMSDKVKKYIKNNGYFNNIVYVDGNVIKEQYQSIERVLPKIREEYPLKIKTRELNENEKKYETLRYQFEGSDNKSVEDSIKKTE